MDWEAQQRTTARQTDSGYHWELYDDRESQVKSRFMPALQQLGIVETEVSGVCDYAFDFNPEHQKPKKVRIDAVIQLHKSVDRHESCLGVEFKGGKMRTAEIGTYMRQCVDYRQTSWKNYGQLPIVACPGLTELICEKVDMNCQTPPLIQEQGEALAYMLRRFVAAFGIGEMFFRRAARGSNDAKHLVITFADDTWLANGQRVNYARKEFGRNQGSK
jgi:hypothetical protein